MTWRIASSLFGRMSIASIVVAFQCGPHCEAASMAMVRVQTYPIEGGDVVTDSSETFASIAHSQDSSVYDGTAVGIATAKNDSEFVSVSVWGRAGSSGPTGDHPGYADVFAAAYWQDDVSLAPLIPGHALPAYVRLHFHVEGRIPDTIATAPDGNVVGQGICQIGFFGSESFGPNSTGGGATVSNGVVADGTPGPNVDAYDVTASHYSFSYHLDVRLDPSGVGTFYDRLDAFYSISGVLGGRGVGGDPLTTEFRFQSVTLPNGLPVQSEFQMTFASGMVIPEPSTIVLAALGFIVLVGWRWRRCLSGCTVKIALNCHDWTHISTRQERR